jgi:hypothetical protein
MTKQRIQISEIRLQKQVDAMSKAEYEEQYPLGRHAVQSGRVYFLLTCFLLRSLIEILLDHRFYTTEDSTVHIQCCENPNLTKKLTISKLSKKLEVRRHIWLG